MEAVIRLIEMNEELIFFLVYISVIVVFVLSGRNKKIVMGLLRYSI